MGREDELEDEDDSPNVKRAAACGTCAGCGDDTTSENPSPREPR